MIQNKTLNKSKKNAKKHCTNGEKSGKKEG